MKILIVLLTISLALAGCVVPSKIDAKLPQGHATKVTATITGKFSNTNIEAENFVKTADKVTADKIHFKHSNAWVPNVEITFEGYERERTPDEKK